MTYKQILDACERRSLRRFYVCCILPSIVLLLLFLSASTYCAVNLLSFR